MAMTNPKGRVNYEPNSWDEGEGPREDPARGFKSFPEEVSGTKQRVRSELFADHYSQARQFYISQTPIEQDHIAAAITFELSKVGKEAIRERMVGHLRNIDADLAQNVADGIGMEKLPEKIKPARKPVDDLPVSDALSILKNAPESFSGRKLGIYIAEGGDAELVKALKKATEDAGGTCAIIAPHVAGAKLSDGKMMPADEKIDGGPSVVFDAVALVMSEDAAQKLATNKPSQDFVSDAFAHVKFIAYSEGAMPLLKAAGIADKMDDGVVEIGAKKDAADFLTQCKQLRFWDRVSG